MSIYTLSATQRKILKNTQIYCYSHTEKKGQPLLNDRPFDMLNFPEIFEQVKDMIISEGFSSVKRVSPIRSNCIIRVFRTEHYVFEAPNWVYNIYGANCYVKFLGTFHTCNDFPIDYSSCKTRSWICQDEYIDFDHQFVDYYVYVS